MDDLAMTDFGLSAPIIEALKSVFKRFPEIEGVHVYGSRATGYFKPYSDIDLAVMAPTMSDRQFALLWNALEDLPILFKLDVVQFEQVSNQALKASILANGKLLYQPTSSRDPIPHAPHP
jgi:proline iminopeptidase